MMSVLPNAFLWYKKGTKAIHNDGCVGLTVWETNIDTSDCSLSRGHSFVSQ